jgi:hypothetical protein
MALLPVKGRKQGDNGLGLARGAPSRLKNEKVFGGLGKLGEWLLMTNELNKAYVEKKARR